ncbi:MAG: glycosyltransferase, partial [Thermoguttaceae bacterium]
MLDKQNTRISLFIPTLGGGGAERVTVYLANGLAEEGYPVELVLLQSVGTHLSRLSEKVGLVDLHASRMLTGVLPLSRYLRSQRPTILITALEHATVGAYLARRLAGVPTPLIASAHSTLSQIIQHSHSLRESMINRAVTWCYGKAEAVVAVSQGTAEDMVHTIGLPVERIHVIYPILTPDIPKLAEEPVDHPWFATGEPGVILAVGSLSPHKDFVTLLKAFAIVQQHVPHRLMILGEGAKRAELEQLAKNLGVRDRVAMPGYKKKVFAFMARASLFVLSSIWEAMPMVVTEALAAGAPVVAADCKSGPREILHDGKYGRLVPVGDVERLAQAMLETLSSPRSKPPEAVFQPFSPAA